MPPSPPMDSPQAPQSHIPTQVVTDPVADAPEIAQLYEQIRQMQIQQEVLRQQLLARDRAQNSYSNRFFEFQAGSPSHYSPAVNLAFSVLKWLFLFVVGFVIACIVSATMGASDIVQTLVKLMELCLVPLTIFTLCVVATVTIFESLH